MIIWPLINIEIMMTEVLMIITIKIMIIKITTILIIILIMIIKITLMIITIIIMTIKITTMIITIKIMIIKITTMIITSYAKVYYFYRTNNEGLPTIRIKKIDVKPDNFTTKVCEGCHNHYFEQSSAS